MAFSDERDYSEESWQTSEVRREGYAELREEHNHGFTVWPDGSRHRLECIDCHDSEACEDYDCLWCVPA